MLKLLAAMPGALRPLKSRDDQPGALDLSAEQAAGQARDFHFAVTWVTLFAHLDPIESSGPRCRSEIPSPTLALVPVAPAPLTEQRAEHRSSSAWEMVVPKMIRTGDGSFAPAETDQRKLS